MEPEIKKGLIGAGIVFILGVISILYFYMRGCETEGCIGLALLMIYIVIITIILMIFTFITVVISFSKKLRIGFWIGVIISIIIYFVAPIFLGNNFFIRDFTVHWERLMIFPAIIFLSTFVGWLINRNQ